MIEINLLPGSGKKSRGRGAGAGLSATIAGIVARVKDPYLLGSVAATIIAISAVGLLWFSQQQREKSLIQKEQKAVQDSTRYATVVAEKRKAEAQRDSVLRQVNIIRNIDEDRFIWAHIMDEVSRALPAYTWVTAVEHISVAVSPAAAPEPAPTNGSATPPTPVKDTVTKAAAEPAGVDTAIVRPTLTFRIKGETVDIQALTRFMRFLETSPFIVNVQLTKTVPKIDAGGNQVTEYELGAEYELPDPAAVRRVPFTLSGR
jgi:type IV pilus assembly protein PilN